MRARAVVVAVGLVLAVAACEPTADPPKKGDRATEDTTDHVVLQFHQSGLPSYGKWYAPRGNTACRWWVEAKQAGSDDRPTVLESGGHDDMLRVPAEKPGKDTYLRYNRACGSFEQVEGPR